ncbi:MAG: prolipoprotein diacylglyceryl transferase family protein [Planctomycetota bacterium]
MYPLIMLTAVLAGGLLLRRGQQTLTLPAADRLAIGGAAFCGAMIGAKLPFAIWAMAGVEPSAAGPTTGPAAGPAIGFGLGPWFASGKTILTGLVGGYLAVEFTKWLLGIRTKTGDTFAVPVAVSVAIGRLGCFYAGCCYGTPTSLPWGVVFPSAGPTPRHPTQLYETAFHLAAAGVLAALHGAGLLRRQLLKLYIIAYAGYRLLSEAIRPEPAYLLGMTAYQWASVAIIAGMAWLWRRDAAQVQPRSPART